MHSDSDVHLFRAIDGGRHWTQVAAWVSGIVGGHSFGGLHANRSASTVISRTVPTRRGCVVLLRGMASC